MKSPFPGMDPYLEPHWLDVHTRLVAYAADRLDEQLPGDLIAYTEERVAIESTMGQERSIGPDIRIFEPPAEVPTVVESYAPGTVLAPYRLATLVEPITERFIKIIEVGTERLVTVIEFLSPTNKQGEGLVAFRAKRADLGVSGVNLVEIDLVRAGNWRAFLRPFKCPAELVTPYRVTFRLPEDPGGVYLQPISLRERLPDITVPLRPNDPKVQLDLQTLLDRVYEKGRYWQRINYSTPLDIPLEQEDAASADELLRAPASGRLVR